MEWTHRVLIEKAERNEYLNYNQIFVYFISYIAKKFLVYTVVGLVKKNSKRTADDL